MILEANLGGALLVTEGRNGRTNSATFCGEFDVHIEQHGSVESYQNPCVHFYNFDGRATHRKAGERERSPPKYSQAASLAEATPVSKGAAAAAKRLNP
jgi:hypothetical protein